jgi:hypothetical protein
MNILARFLIGFGIAVAVITHLTSCALKVSDYGNHHPIEYLGLPVDLTEATFIYNTLDSRMSIALHTDIGQDELGIVTDMTFVAAPFICDEALYGSQRCFGLTHNRLDGTTYSEVALVQADYTEAPTTSLGCTAMAHELAHSWLYAATGDADSGHTNPKVWGSEGVIVGMLSELCTSWAYTPNNINPTKQP